MAEITKIPVAAGALPLTAEQRVDRAMEMHVLGYNCAQCVAVATCDLAGADPAETFLFAEGLGGGLGGFTETCGALTGAAMVISYAHSRGIEAHDSKKETYALVKPVIEQFRAQFGSSLCADIRLDDPEERVRACNGFIAAGVKLVVDAFEPVG